MATQAKLSDYGISVGTLPSGPLGKISDVPGVTVGHCTVDTQTQKTGVTVVMPCADDMFAQKLPARCLDDGLWERRYRQLRDYERYLTENGTTVIKFFLHISKEEQRRRFLARIEDKAKNWKFSASDIAERAHWDAYMRAYQQAIDATAVPDAPWYVVPADKKWFARLLISEIVADTLERLGPAYPQVDADKKKALARCRQELLEEEES